MRQPYFDDGVVRIYHGNCVDVLAEFPECFRVDHVISDPPYARDVYIRLARTPEPGDYQIRDGSAVARMAAGDIGHIDDLLDPVAAHCARITNRWVLVFSDAETTWRWRAALEKNGLRYVRTGAWVKPDAMPQMTGDRPSVGFEPCTIAHAQGKMRWNGGGKPALWTHFTAKGHARPDHPCPKPEPLMLELVQQFTDPGDVILDPFMGSGTTLYAAKRLGRKAIGCEVNERFAEIAAKRLAQGALDLFGEATL
jgi:DNA modification methylase